ncbi:MAG: spore germination protein [Lachnospiraceae bacterium]|nr:spore germination protein [Lachnospiraceae bacterium]
MNDNTLLSTSLQENIAALERLLPIGTSFDLVSRHLYLGDTPAYWLGVNGLCRTEILQQIFSDLQNPLYVKNGQVEDIVRFMSAKIGYAQVTLTDSMEEILRNVLSGPSVLFIDGFAQALLIDVRTYPTRSISEPDAEKITRGARDGFVETLLFNANLIRRRVRSTDLTFAIHNVGTDSKTDVAIAYLGHSVNQELLEALTHTLQNLKVTSLTMGSKSLEELLVKKHWWNPLPSIQLTERPDVACSYLLEGHILIIVDNSPGVLILPGTIFQFTQSPEDYYKSPLIGSYFRLVRLACIPVSLLLMPLFLLVTAYFPEFAQRLQLLHTENLTPIRLIVYVIAVEFILDLFRYSASVSSSHVSGSLSIVGGLIIGDIAVNLNWASPEVLFYGAVTLLTSLSISSVEFADALRVYRIFLVIVTGFFGLPGFIIGMTLVSLSIATTPSFGGMSYFWPLVPFNGKALRNLLFRCPTYKAQPSRVWNRGHVTKRF